MLMRSVRSAICTSGEPVSVSWRRYSLIVVEGSGIVRFVLFRHRAVGGLGDWSSRVRTPAAATLMGREGKPAGHVALTTRGAHLRVEVAATGLKAGFHGLHLHSKGLCEPATGFSTAGPHVNPSNGNHPGHAGDLPSLFARSDGVARGRFLTDRVTLAELLDADGTAVIVPPAPHNFPPPPASPSNHHPPPPAP